MVDMQHTQLPSQKSKDRFLQKSRAFHLKIQKQSALPAYLVLTNSRKYECKCCQPKKKDEKKVAQYGIREDEGIKMGNIL